VELEDVWMPATARHTHDAADRSFGELFSAALCGKIDVTNMCSGDLVKLHISNVLVIYYSLQIV
jgi:hypothetical protein